MDDNDNDNHRIPGACVSDAECVWLPHSVLCVCVCGASNVGLVKVRAIKSLAHTRALINSQLTRLIGVSALVIWVAIVCFWLAYVFWVVVE